MSLAARRNTTRYAFLVLVAMILLVFHAVPVWAGPVALWHEGATAVSSMLPDDWRKMTQEEWAEIFQDNKAIIPDQSGTLVAGFQPGSNGKNADSPYIPVLTRTRMYGERVSLEMIQKTYVWLQKNNELMKGMLPAEVNAMHIENIEYRQDQPSIFFQTRLDMSEAIIVGVSAIFFLNNGYMNVVCIASERKIADYKGIFHSFINRVSIPPSLHYSYSTGPDNSPAVSVIARFRAWFLASAKPLLGVAMLITIYILVFRVGRGKRLKG